MARILPGESGPLILLINHIRFIYRSVHTVHIRHKGLKMSIKGRFWGPVTLTPRVMVLGHRKAPLLGWRADFLNFFPGAASTTCFPCT